MSVFVVVTFKMIFRGEKTFFDVIIGEMKNYSFCWDDGHTWVITDFLMFLNFIFIFKTYNLF